MRRSDRRLHLTSRHDTKWAFCDHLQMSNQESAMKMNQAFRRHDDPFRDFCQWDYEPVVVPEKTTLQQSAVLLKSLPDSLVGRRLLSIFTRIQACWGEFNTVWGIKSTDGILSWELYFYDYGRDDRRLGISDLAKCLPELVAPGLAAGDRWPWFMFSVEFDSTALKTGEIGSVDLYFEHEGGTISAGVSEVWDGKLRQRKNDYRFYRSALDRAELLKDLCDLPSLPEPLAPGRYDEEIFVISRKAISSAVYFSRVDVRRTLQFAHENGFSPALTEFLTADAGALAPYRFDLGIDFSVQSGKSVVRRSAIYGIF